MGDPSKQHHDWEPGVRRSGLAWTIPIASSWLQVNAQTGAARMHARNVPVPDFHDFQSAVLGGGPKPVPSHVSFDCRWAGHGDARRVTDKTFGFTGRFITGPATITFRAANDGSPVVYTSDPDGQRNPGPDENGAGSPAVGRERNGVFFRRAAG